MANKKIQFEVGSTGQDQVANGFNKVDKAAQNMDRSMQAASGGTRKNSQSMIEFGRIIQDAPYGIQGVANNVTRLAETMNVGAPLLLGISLATSALVVLMGRSKDTKEEINKLADSVGNLKKAFDSLIQIKNPLEDMFFPIKSGDLQKVLGTVRDQLEKQKELTNKSVQTVLSQPSLKGRIWTTDAEEVQQELARRGRKEAGALFAMMQERNALEALIVKLKENITQTKSLELAQNALVQSGLQPTTKELEKQAEQAAKINKLLSGMQNYIDKVGTKGVSSITSEKFGKDAALWTEKINNVAKPSVGDVLDFTKGEQDLVDFVNTITFSLTDTLQSGFSQAWEKIFGEANSLVEQLLSNLANGLMNLAAQKASSAIFDFILGLIPGGSAVSGVLSVANSGFGGNGTYTPRMQGGNTTTIIKLGDETVLKLVNGVLPQAYNNSVRYRELETA